MRGTTKTRLMYSAYLSYAQLKEYLAFLREKDLLAYDADTQLFRLTERGLHFLNIYGEVSELLTPENKTELNETTTPRSLHQDLLEIRQ